jgi:hypothetical protein
MTLSAAFVDRERDAGNSDPSARRTEMVAPDLPPSLLDHVPRGSNPNGIEAAEQTWILCA